MRIQASSVALLVCLGFHFNNSHVFRRVRLVTKSVYYLRHVHPFRMCQRTSHWMHFREILYWELV